MRVYHMTQAIILEPPELVTDASTNCRQLTSDRCCEAIASSGNRCGVPRRRGRRFCVNHDTSPDTVAMMNAARQKGGLNGRVPAEIHKAHRAQEHADLRKLPPADFRRVIRLVYKEFCRRQKRGDIRDGAWPRVGDRPT